MGDLRKKLIRLAHSRPDLRPQLLPLLSKEAATRYDQKTIATFTLEINSVKADGLITDLDSKSSTYGQITGGNITTSIRISMSSYIPLGGNEWAVPVYADRNLVAKISPGGVVTPTGRMFHRNAKFNAFLTTQVFQEGFKKNWPMIQSKLLSNSSVKTTYQTKVDVKYQVLITKLDNVDLHYSISNTYGEMLYGNVVTSFIVVLRIPSYGVLLPVVSISNEPGLMYEDPGGGIYVDLKNKEEYHPDRHYNTFLWSIVNDAFWHNWHKWIKNVPSDLEQT